MKILYGVTGEGLGHAMRSRVVLDWLRQRGHETLVAASGRAVDYLRRYDHRVLSIDGFELQYEGDALRRARTLAHNIQRAPKALRHNLAAFSTDVDPFAPDLCVTDFDSFAHAYGRRKRLPVVSIDHHHVITRCTHTRDLKALLPRGFSLTRGVVRVKIPNCSFYIASSFYTPNVRARLAGNTRVIGPILRPELLDLVPSSDGPVLVYQTSRAHGRLVDILRTRPHIPFVVYGMGRDDRQGNVTCRAFDEARFLSDLASARAVITNGGHTVMAEALCLGKRLLSVPVRHHGEQEINAAYLHMMSYGRMARRLDTASLSEFLSWVASAATPVRVTAGNDALPECLDEALRCAKVQA
jgi:uncharacterized protein (TIGR00661 family)